MKPTTNRFNAPLMSWDIFITHFHDALKLGADVQELGKLKEEQRWQQSWDFEARLAGDKTLIIVTNTDGRIVFASANMYALTGYSAEQVIRQPWPFSQDIAKATAPAMHHRTPFTADVVNYTKNGRAYHSRLEVFPLFNQTGTLVNFIAFENML